MIVADIKLRTSQKFSSVEYFIDKFSVLHTCISDDNNNCRDQIEIQFSLYQIEKLSADIIEEDRIDKSCLSVDVMYVFSTIKEDRVETERFGRISVLFFLT
jgi:hypothetical protein